MHRILIIGNAGSGKSTFARALAEKTRLPLCHLDQLYWCGHWTHVSREDFDAALQEALDQPTWIIDGNYNRTLPHRLTYCDTVFYFDLPAVVSLWGVTKRVIKNYGKTRPDMGGNCPECFDGRKWELYRNVMTFNRQHRKDYYELLENTRHAKVTVFRSRRQVKKFLKSLQ
jgi:adenylate kinase family enzyme